MARLKHSKVKNTGLIFELLIRQVAADTMDGSKSNALRLIRKHFNANSVLFKELKLYRALSEETFPTETKAEKFVEAVINTRGKLSESELRRAKYNLIKDLKEFCNPNEFFKARVTNYKLQASIFKLFEYNEVDDPKEYVETKFGITEHVQRDKNQKVEEKAVLVNEHKDIRILASKIVIDKFNQKYSDLGTKQKKLLREYINNVTDTVKLKDYILSEVVTIKTDLDKLASTIPSKVVRIKLHEISNMLEELNKRHVIKDKDVLTILRYYELIEEIKKIGAK
jgi:hypothetical protein